MKLNYLIALTTASILTVGGTTFFANSTTASSFNSTDASVIVAGNDSSTANSSQFVAAASRYNVQGTLKVVEENGKKYVEFSDDFQVSQGPALEIILHKDEIVQSRIAESDYISIATIKSFEGNQRYEIPEGVNLEDYASVAVWCEEFNSTFAYANL